MVTQLMQRQLAAAATSVFPFGLKSILFLCVALSVGSAAEESSNNTQYHSV